MNAMAYQITRVTIVYLIVYSGIYQGKHQSSASLAILRGIHRWLSGVPDYFDRNKISSGGDLSHYSSASLY